MEEKIVVKVWRFKNARARHGKNFWQAVEVGTASTHEELVALAGGGYLGYTDAETGEWLSYGKVKEFWGEKPWASMEKES